MLTLSADNEVGGERKTTAWGAVISVRQTRLRTPAVVEVRGRLRGPASGKGSTLAESEKDKDLLG